MDQNLNLDGRHFDDIITETSFGIRSSKCNQCNYTSDNLSSLKRHQKTHTGEKRYKCDQCDYSSYQGGQLRRHQKTHNGEKRYTCNYCEYASYEAGNVKKHLIIHRRERPNECNVCNRKFANAERLKKPPVSTQWSEIRQMQMVRLLSPSLAGSCILVLYWLYFSKQARLFWYKNS